MGRCGTDSLVLLELVADPVDDALVEIVTAEVGVAVGRVDLEDALAEVPRPRYPCGREDRPHRKRGPLCFYRHS